MLENDYAVTVLGWKEFKRKILLITAVVFFAGFTIGCCVGCSVEESLTPTSSVNVVSDK